MVVVHKPFVCFTGSLEAALLLGQLLYWAPRSSANGWIAKTAFDLMEELSLIDYSLREARADLTRLGILQTKVKRFAGSPTVHYRLKVGVLKEKWTTWCQQMDLLKSTKLPVEIDETITEITTETTKLATTTGKSDVVNFVEVYKRNIGEITPVVFDALAELAEEYPFSWFRSAVAKACVYNHRNLKYVIAILERWKAGGSAS